MGLHTGEKFVVIGRRDMLILKRLKAPTMEDFDAMIRKGHEHAKKNKLTEKDLNEAVTKARAKR